MRDTSSILRSERSPGGGNGSPLQYSCLESPMDRGVWWAAVHVVAKSQMTEVTLHTHTLTCPLRKSYIVSSVQEAWWSTGVYGREAALLSPFPTLLVLGLNLQYPYPALLALRAVPCIYIASVWFHLLGSYMGLETALALHMHFLIVFGDSEVRQREVVWAPEELALPFLTSVLSFIHLASIYQIPVMGQELR